MGVRQFTISVQLYSRYRNKVKGKRVITCFFCGEAIKVGDQVVSRQSKNPENNKGLGLPSTRRVLYHKSCAEGCLII